MFTMQCCHCLRHDGHPESMGSRFISKKGVGPTHKQGADDDDFSGSRQDLEKASTSVLINQMSIIYKILKGLHNILKRFPEGSGCSGASRVQARCSVASRVPAGCSGASKVPAGSRVLVC